MLTWLNTIHQMIEKRQNTSLGHAGHQPNWQDRSFWNCVPQTGMSHQHEASCAPHKSFFTKNKCHLLLSSELLFQKNRQHLDFCCHLFVFVCMRCMCKGISWVWEHMWTWIYLGASCIWEPQVGNMSSLKATFYILILDLSPEPKTYQFN